MNTIIFDFDGVIHDTFDFHIQKIKEMIGYDIDEQLFKDIHNGNFFDAELPEEVKNIDWFQYGKFIYEDKANLKTDTKVKEFIEKLGQNYDLFIITSGTGKSVEDYLKNNGLYSYFKEVLGAEKLKKKTEKFKCILNNYSLNKDDCVFITDTLGDILEANEVGIKTYAVDFGYHDKFTLEKGNPHKIISSFEELVEDL